MKLKDLIRGLWGSSPRASKGASVRGRALSSLIPHRSSLITRILDSWFRRPAIWSIIALTILATVVFVVQAANKTWDGGVAGTQTALDNNTSWVGDVVPATTDEVLMDNSVKSPLPATLTTTGASPTYGDLIWNTNDTSTITINTGTATSRMITLSAGGGFTAASGAGGTTNDLLLMGTNATSNTLTIGGNAGVGTGRLALVVSADGNFDVVNSGATLNITGILSGNLNLTKTGAGKLTLSGVNTFGAAKIFALNGGTVNINSTTALGAAANTFQINGGTIDNTSGAAITISNNNAQTWNGDFTFTGGSGTTHDLNFGTGAISLGTTAGTTRIITTSAGALTVGGIVSNGTTANALTKTGTGTLALSGANNYTGATTINQGTLALTGSGSLANSSSITVGATSTVGTFDVSGLTSQFTLASGQGMLFPSTAATSTITTTAGKGILTAANSPLTFSYNTFAPVNIAGAGSFNVQATNVVTVNTGSALGAGDYILISKGVAGSTTGTAPTNLTIGGSGLAAGMTGVLQIQANELVLHVAAAGNTISGTLNTGASGETITLLKNGGSAQSVATTAGGAYSFSGVSYSSGDILTVFVDNDPTVKGATVTRGNSGDITGLNIDQNTLTVRHEDAGPITNANLATGNSGDADLTAVYSVSGGNLTLGTNMALDVASGKTYAPGGNVTTTNLTNAGTLSPGSATVNIGGIFTNTGTFSKGTSTINYNQQSDGQNVLALDYATLQFSNFNKVLASSGTIGITNGFSPGTATGHTVTGSTIEYHLTGLTGSSTTNLPPLFTHYNNLKSNELGNTVGPPGLVVDDTLEVVQSTFTSASDYNNVVIDPGATLTLSNDITVSGNWTNNGTLVHNNHKVTFDGTGAQTITTGGTSAGQTFAAVAISKASGTATLAGDLSDNTLTITGGTFDQAASFSVNSGAVTVSAGATWNNIGTGDLTLSGDVSNAGTINFNANGNGCGQNDDIQIRSSATPTQRAWSGTGTFSMTDVDVKDQAGTAVIIVKSGTDSGHNGLNWHFLSVAASCNAYTWTGAINSDWTNALNWSPTRTTTASSDILYFTSGVNVTNVAGATGGNTETIAELHINGASPNFSTAGANTLLINAGSGVTGLDINNAFPFAISGSNALTVKLAAGTLGSISASGTIINVSGGAHRIIGQAASAITFGNGTFFTTDTGFTGNAFGAGTGDGSVNGAVVFASGSIYTHQAGGSPFGDSSHNVVVFNTSSLARWYTTSGFEASGRTYGTLEIGDGITTLSLSDTGSGDFTFYGLTINNPSSSSLPPPLTYKGTGSSTVYIRGDIQSNGGSGDVQDINLKGGTGGVVIDAGGGSVSFADNNGQSRGIEFDSDARVASNTTLTLNRKLLMGPPLSPPTFVLSVPVDATLNDSSTGYVVGKLLKNFDASHQTQTFRMGDVAKYSPIVVSSASGTGTLTINARTPKHPSISGTNALGRYWQIANVGLSSANLAFHYPASDVAGTEGNYKFFRYESGTFTQYDVSSLDTTNANDHIATLNGVTQFSDWTLAEPSAVPKIDVPENYFDSEGNSGQHNFSFLVSRSISSTQTITFHYATSDGGGPGTAATGGASCTAGVDYISTSGDFTINPNDTGPFLINVAVCGDKTVEPDEQFTLTLTNLTNAIFGQSSTLATITNDDNAPVADAVTDSTTFNTTKTLTLSATDADGDALTFSIVGNPAHGTLSNFGAPGCSSGICSEAVDYAPTTGYYGPDSFTYKANDGANDSNTATVSLTVAPPLSLVVNKTADTNDGVCDSDCSLREAIAAANLAADTNTITFDIPLSDAGCNSGLGPCTITLTSGNEIQILNSVNVTGPGARQVIVDGGSGTNRIFYIGPYAVTISGLTIQHGHGGGGGTSGIGGAIYLDGNVSGGGSLKLDSVLVQNNTAASSAGGVYFGLGATQRIINSTITGNSSLQCGGFFKSSSDHLYMANSTVSNNSATNGGLAGGGFCDYGSGMVVRNTTITNNHADTGGWGGGILLNGSTLNLGNTIVAGNTASGGGAIGPDFFGSGSITSAGYNLIGDNSQVASTFPTGAPNGNNDWVGDSSTPLNPQLASLADNGGPTLTHALNSNSVAIDHGSNALAVDPFDSSALSFDQRGAGFSREVDGNSDGTAVVDIGAFESPTCTTPPATPNASNGGPYCEGATIQLSTDTVSGATYAWTGPNGFTSALQNPTRANATIADAGTYSVALTVNGCNSAAGTTNVIVNARPATPTASNGGPYCEGATIQLSTDTVSGATYAWTGPNGFTSSLQNPTRANATTNDAGTYSVTVTMSGCTSAAGTTNVVVNLCSAEIAVEQPAGTDLTSGSATPIDFGSSDSGVPTSPETFTIKNKGTGDLTITGVTSDSPEFVVNTFGMTTTVAPNNSTTFTVTFTPAGPGPRNSAIHIANNDSDENPFEINVTGTGNCPTGFVVNSTGDGDDITPNDGICADDGGKCTLRAAIHEANALGGDCGPVAISFNIPANDSGHVYYKDDGMPGQVSAANITTTSVSDDANLPTSGPLPVDPDYKNSWWRIRLNGSLPGIEEGLTIDGYTQGFNTPLAASPNTNALNAPEGDNAILRIEVDGSQIDGGGGDGFGLFANEGCTIKGLAIDNFDNSDIYIEDSGNDIIVGNFIGTDISGTLTDSTLSSGLNIGVNIDSGEGIFIGSEDRADRNIISGHGGEGGAGVFITTSSNSVEGNYIGTDRTGAGAVPNTYGVIISGRSGNFIGCDVIDGDNVISGNTDTGVRINDGDSNFIKGNFIGTDKTGQFRLPNGTGVVLYHTSANYVGVPDSGNVISGNNGEGVELNGSSTGNLVQSNLIGVAFDGSTPLANKGNGVEVYDDSTNNTIGVPVILRVDQTAQPNKRTTSKVSKAGPVSAEECPCDFGANTIANNGEDGVRVTSSGDINNRISQNSIYANTLLGINLVSDGDGADEVTLNDSCDTDPGPNHLQNFPELISADVGTQTITGKLNSTFGGSDYVIEFFVNPAGTCDSPSNHVEGKLFIGSATTGQITDDGTCEVAFTFGQPLSNFSAGDVITATATDIDANTSEFSACFPVPAAAPNVSVALTSPASVTEDGAANLVYRFTRSDPTGSLTINFSVGGTATFNTDYTQNGAATFGATTGTITFTGGNATVDVTIDPTADTNPEADETVKLTVTSGTGYNVGSPSSATGTITNDDCPTTFVVTDTGDADDAVPGDGHCDTDSGTPGDQCTLRAAIREAALSSCGTITIDATGVNGTIDLSTALPDINHNVNINGPGANQLTVQRNSASGFRIFTVSPDRTVSISGLTIANGSDSIGGGLYNNHGTLTISNCAISGNHATSEGGGIYNGGIVAGSAALTITGSTISGNSSAADGGGIYSDADSGTASLTMTNCTVSGNTANNHVGGVYVISSPATLTNVTITNNRADNDNTAGGAAGGLSESGGTVTLHNTIVAGNFRGGSPSTVRDDINGTLQAASSYNLIGDGTGMSGISNADANHNQVGSSGSPIDALLAPLAYHRGPTQVHALLYNSPAIDVGDDAVTGLPLSLVVDQRGQSRPADGDLNSVEVHVDIGAYERQPTETRDVPDGSTVNVDLADARVTFPCVPAGGCSAARANPDSKQTGKAKLSPAADSPIVSISDVDPSTQPEPPSGFVIGNSSTPPLPAFDVSTSPLVTFDTPVTLCFYLPSLNDQTFFDGIRLFHNNGSSLDLLANQTRNFANRLVCGETGSLSPFVIGHTATPTVANGTVSGEVVDTNGNPVEGAAVRLSGSQNRLTITDAQGRYHFDDVETNGLYVVTPSRANFTFSPSQRSFSQLGSHTEATFTAAANSGGLNPLDTTEYFVRQQYLDFLGREPDESGFNFWVNNIESCGNDIGCREVKRIDTSAAFFLSIEFQQTGYLVYRTYQAAYADLPDMPVPIRLSEFKPDTQEISNGVIVLQDGWQQKLENNKQAFAAEFVQRSRFTQAYPVTMTPTEFVDKLFANSGVPLTDSDHAAAIAEFGTATDSSDNAARGRALRRVAENSTLARQQFNQAFVLMEYFGYLRRDPNSGQDTDFSGYNFWLDKLNRFNGNFQSAEMVKAFLSSIEYRARFPR